MAKTKAPRRTRKSRTALVLATAMCLLPAPAAATVYVLGDDGSVRVERQRTPAVDSATTSASVPDAAPEVPAAAVTRIAEPNVPRGFRQPLLDASRLYDVSPRLLAALAARESGWRASIVSRKGAVGLTQLMPATARALSVDPRQPSANLAGGARYLRQLIDQFNGNIEQALAAYNAGPGRVVRAMGIPAISETRSYVTNIVDRLGSAVLGEGKP